MSTTLLHTQHERRFAQNRFVYPVLSRRSGGLSIGVNLNPDKVCNFDCIYCQVDRTTQSETQFVNVTQLLDELDHMLPLAASGEIFLTEKFHATPPDLRRLNDIAFSAHAAAVIEAAAPGALKHFTEAGFRFDAGQATPET